MADSYNELFGLGSHSQDAHLEGWWPLQDDAASTVVEDVSTNANDGTLAGGNDTEDLDDFGPGRGLVSALRLDGTDDLINIGDIAALNHGTGDLTLGAWASTRVGSGSSRIIAGKTESGGNGVAEYHIGTINGRVWGAVRDGSDANGRIDADADYTTNQWYHVCVVRVSGVVRLYVDGVQQSATRTISGSVSSSRTFTIGSRDPLAGGADLNWPGRIAGVGNFSRGLSATEVGEWKNGPEPLNITSPTLAIDGFSWSGTVGTWDSQSNGALAYTWELRRSADDSVVESGIGANPSGSGRYPGGDYYLWMRASNDGGHDPTEDQASASQTVATVVAVPVPVLTMQMAGA